MTPLLPLIRRIALLKVGWGTLVWLVLLAVFHPLFLPLLGYYVNEPGWKVAQVAAEKKDVYVCDRLISSYYNIFISTDELQLDCIREYAALTKDPTACRLLPGPEKPDCVGGAMQSAQSFLCLVDGRGNVRGNGLDVPLANCLNGSDSVRLNACCSIALVSKLLDRNDCSMLATNQPFFDECQYQLSLKNHDPSQCESILNMNIKSGCLVEANALRQDPSICQGCTKPYESVEELLRLNP